VRIDWWTLGLQAINFLVLAWLLHRFLYRPVMAAVAARQEAADRLTAEAAARRREAEAAAAEAGRQLAAVAEQRDHLLTEGERAAEAARRRLLEQGAAEHQRLLAEARAAIRRETSVAAEELRLRTVDLAAAMAARLLREAPVPDEPFLDRLLAEIAGLPEQTRAALRAGPLEVATARPLAAAAAREECAAALAEALEGPPAALTFATDPRLVAGIELRSHATVVRSTLAADLTRIAEELAQDDGPLRAAG
jgi:F-type H+-transporting ATPase subunit b